MKKSFGGVITSCRFHSTIHRLSPNTLLSHSILRASQLQKCFFHFPYTQHLHILPWYTTLAHPTVIHNTCTSYRDTQHLHILPWYTTPAHPTLIHTHSRDVGCSLLTSMERFSSNLSVWSRETSLTGCSVVLETLLKLQPRFWTLQKFLTKALHFRCVSPLRHLDRDNNFPVSPFHFLCSWPAPPTVGFSPLAVCANN